MAQKSTIKGVNLGFFGSYITEGWEDIDPVGDSSLLAAKDRIDRFVKSLESPVYHQYP